MNFSTLTPIFDVLPFLEECNQAIFNENIYNFKYPNNISNQNWDSQKMIDEIKRLNNTFLKSLIHKANLYLIYERKPNGHWVPKYIGHSLSRLMRNRITAHLIFKNRRTGSAVYQKNKANIITGNETGVALIKVEPEVMRKAVEDYIIKANYGLLEYNNYRN